MRSQVSRTLSHCFGMLRLLYALYGAQCRSLSFSLSSQLLYWRSLTLETLRWPSFRRFNWTTSGRSWTQHLELSSRQVTNIIYHSTTPPPVLASSAAAHILQACRPGIPVRLWSWTCLPDRRPSLGRQDSWSTTPAVIVDVGIGLWTSRLQDCPLSATERFPSQRHRHETVCQLKWRHQIPCKPSTSNWNLNYSWRRFPSFYIFYSVCIAAEVLWHFHSEFNVMECKISIPLSRELIHVIFTYGCKLCAGLVKIHNLQCYHSDKHVQTVSFQLRLHLHKICTSNTAARFKTEINAAHKLMFLGLRHS